MNSFLYFSVALVAVFSLQTAADLIDTGCQFIRQHDDLVDPMVQCETDNYPERFNEISAICLNEATGMTKAQHIRATCRNRENLQRTMFRIQSCVMRHQEDIMGMLSGIANGMVKSQECIRRLVTDRLIDGNRVRRSLISQLETESSLMAVLSCC